MLHTTVFGVRRAVNLMKCTMYLHIVLNVHVHTHDSCTSLVGTFEITPLSDKSGHITRGTLLHAPRGIINS